jgi:hypothetical protein
MKTGALRTCADAPTPAPALRLRAGADCRLRRGGYIARTHSPRRELEELVVDDLAAAVEDEVQREDPGTTSVPDL